MRLRPTWAGLIVLVLVLPAAASEPEPGPPPPLDGVPLDFRCSLTIPEDHPLLARQPGQDLRDLAGGDDVEAATWLRDHLCELVWGVLDAAGFHPLAAPMPMEIEAVVRPHVLRQELLVAAALEGCEWGMDAVEL